MDHGQHFVVGTFASFLITRANATFERFDHQRSLRGVAHIELGPSASGRSLRPFRHALPRTIRWTAATSPQRSGDFQIADRSVARNGESAAADS